MTKPRAIILGAVMTVMALFTLSACGGDPVPPTATPLPPTATAVPPTPTTVATAAPTSQSMTGGSTSGSGAGMAATDADLAFIQDAVTQTNKLTSYHYGIMLNTANVKETADMQGDYVAPNKGYIKGKVAGQDIEQLMVGKDAFVKDPNGKWVPRQVPTSTGTDIKLIDPTNFTSSPNPLAGFNDLLNSTTNVRDLGKETVNGVSTRHFSFSVDVSRSMGASEETKKAMGGIIPPIGNGEIWIDPSTKYIHRVNIALDMGVLMSAISKMMEAALGTPGPGTPTATVLPSINLDMKLNINKHNDPSISVPDAPAVGASPTNAQP